MRILVFFLILFSAAASFAADPVKPSGSDKCPVCGMFVAKYPDFLAQVIFKDGSYAVFDGAKDMFQYYLNLQGYSPSKKAEDIESVYVTDYYALAPVDGMKAFYVIGSNVTGPMGKELIPFEKKEEAQEFMSDHSGKKMIEFKEVTPEIMKSLE